MQQIQGRKSLLDVYKRQGDFLYDKKTAGPAAVFLEWNRPDLDL